MKKMIVFITFLFLTVSIFSANNYFEFKLDLDNYNYQQTQIFLNLSNVYRVELQLDSNYQFFHSYFNLSSWGSGSTYTLQLGFNIQPLWQNNNQKILAMFQNGLLSSSGTKIGEVLLLDSTGEQLDFIDVYFVVDNFFVDYNVSNDIVFEFTPPYPGSGKWYDQKSSNVSLKSNLPPLHVYVGVELLDGFDFLSEGSYLQFLGSPNTYLNNPNVELDITVGSNLGNLFKNYGSLLQEKFVEAGFPEEGLHVGDAVVSIPMEGGYFSYLAVPIYFKVPEPVINFIVGGEGTIQLTFDLANPQNNVISSVPAHIESTLPKYDIYLSLDIFDSYNFLEDYIILQSDEVISVENGNTDFDIEIKADFADLWNDKREQILSLFENEVLTVNEIIHIGDVYITLSSS
jgi:hypothetical protein